MLGIGLCLDMFRSWFRVWYYTCIAPVCFHCVGWRDGQAVLNSILLIGGANAMGVGVFT